MTTAIAGFILMLPVHYILVGFAEYGMHRLFMHHRRGGYIFKGHHKEHHGQDKHTPWHIDLPLRGNHLPITAPFIAFMIWRGLYQTTWAWGSLVALLLVLTWHSYVWTKAHRAFHGIEHNWTERLWCYEEMRRHHFDHHAKPNRNYGVLYFWVDRLFGTYERIEDETRTH